MRTHALFVRRAFFAAFLVSFLIVFTDGHRAAADVVTPSDRVTEYVNVRDAPRGAPAAVVGRLNRGESATLIRAVPYYYQIRLANGTEGYVSKSWTARQSDAGTPAVAGAGNLVIHFIDVGQGDATLVQCPNGQVILVDAGSTAGNIEPDAVRDYIAQHLNQNGLRLDVLVVTHPDADHYNLLEEVLNEVRIGHVFRVGQRSHYRDRGVWDWMNGIGAQNVTTLGPDNYDRIDRPNAVMECGQADVWVMAAGVRSSQSWKNAMSIVLMIRYGDFEAVLTGDATFATEEVIRGRYPADWLDADLLKIGHHGSSTTSTSPEWADTIRPRLAVASASFENSYGHPRLVVIERLEPFTEQAAAHPVRYSQKTGQQRRRFVDRDDYNEAIYTTSTNGTVVVTSGGLGFNVQTHSE